MVQAKIVDKDGKFYLYPEFQGSAIYEYCEKMGQEDLCQRWIQKHKEDNLYYPCFVTIAFSENDRFLTKKSPDCKHKAV